MLNSFKIIEILISIQSLIISTMIPVFMIIPLKNNFNYDVEFPITWQVPALILISLLFKKNNLYIALSLYLIMGLFVIPIFHQGGSLGYLLTPNFGYLIGFYPLIKIISNLNKKTKYNIPDFIKSGILAICCMHLTGICYGFIQLIFYKQTNIFFYNLGFYSLGKIGYHFLMLLPLSFFIKPINYFKSKFK